MSLDDYSCYDDCSLPDLTYTEPYYSDSEPEFHIRRRPSIPQHLSRSTTKLQDPHLKCDRNLGWNIDWATAYLVDHINKKHDAAESLKNTRIKATNLAREGLTKAIPFRIFNKLSETLFAGHLNNAVYLESRSLESDVSGATYTKAWGPVTSVKRVSIVMNSDVLAYATARDVVAMLIHHMIHAFFLVACGPQKEEEVPYGRLSHGYHFSMVMYTIRDLSAVYGTELDSLDFGHPFTNDRCRRRAESDEEREKWYCSHCHAHVSALSQGQVESWYEKYIAPMHAQSSKSVRLSTVQIYNDRRCELESMPRARLPACIDTVEIIHSNTSTLLKKSDVERHALSLLRPILATKSRFLKLESKDVHPSSFQKFIEFICTGEWRPTLPHIVASSSSTAAPVIKSTFGLPSAATTTPILDDIKMAKSFTFSEVRTYALSRLHAHETCREDPVAILEALYAGREPHHTLREWGARFLSKRDTQGIINLQKLRTSPLFAELVERRGGLENEVRKVLERSHGSSSSALDFSGMGMGMHVLDQGFSNAAGRFGEGIGDMLSMQLHAQMRQLPPAQYHNIQHEQQQQHQLRLGPLAPNPLTLPCGFSNPFPPYPFSFPFSSPHPAAMLRNMERDNIRRIDLEREKDRLRETQAQVHAAAMVKQFYGRGMGGFVEDGSDDGGY